MLCAILCDGNPPDPDQIRESIGEAALFIAADGGALIASAMNLSPDVIIGDLDSYESDGLESARVIHDPDQETNDLEKALTHAKEAGARGVTVFGATGKRLDHTLKNLSVLKQFSPQFDSLLFRDRFCDIFLLPNEYKATFKPGTSISLFPLSGRVDGVTTTGLKYPLTNGFLENGVRDGSSNETTEEQIRITHQSGDLLIFINHP